MGRNHRARWSAIGAAVAVSIGAGGLITFVSASGGGASSFVAVTPCRLLDTRVDGPATGAAHPRITPLGQQETLVVPVRGNYGDCVALSPTATGAVLNVTTVNSTAGSYLTVWPADKQRPLASNLNWIAGQGATPNQVTTGLDSNGNLKAFNATGSVDVIIDVVGMYEPSSVGGGNQSSDPGAQGPKGDEGAKGAKGPQGASGTQLMTSSKPDGSASNGQSSSIKLDSNGNPVISHAGGGQLRLTHCDDPACGLSHSNVVDDGGINGDIVGDYTSLQLDADGFPLISYYDTTNGDLKLAHCSDAACEGASVNIVDGNLSGADVGQFTSLQLDDHGLPVISYYDATNHQLKLARCADLQCASASSNAVETGEGSDYGQFSSLVLDQHDGRPTIGYSDAGADSLMLVHCTTDDCAGGQAAVLVDASAGANLSMTVDQAGNPVMAYYGTSSSALVITRCADPACVTVATGEPIMGLANAAIDTSIVVDPITDLATASYIDGSNTYSDIVMRVVHCNDAGCTDADSTTPDPVAGEVPANTSMVLDLHGNPIVSRYDSGASKLVVLHCVDPLCTPHIKVIASP